MKSRALVVVYVEYSVFLYDLVYKLNPYVTLSFDLVIHINWCNLFKSHMCSSLVLVYSTFLMQQCQSLRSLSSILASLLAPSNVHLVELTLTLQTMS